MKLGYVSLEAPAVLVLFAGPNQIRAREPRFSQCLRVRPNQTAIGALFRRVPTKISGGSRVVCGCAQTKISGENRVFAGPN